MAISLNPRDSTHSIKSLIRSTEKPIYLPAPEMHLLDFHSDGISSVREALDDEPISGTKKRELSRYTSRVTTTRMLDSDVFREARKARRDYLTNKKHHPERVRKYYDDILAATARGYKPFVASAGEIHVWFWDDEDKNKALTLLRDCGIAHNFFFCMMADPLSEIEELGRIADDLREEYLQGMRYLNYLLSVYKHCAKATKVV